MNDSIQSNLIQSLGSKKLLVNSLANIKKKPAFIAYPTNYSSQPKWIK